MKKALIALLIVAGAHASGAGKGDVQAVNFIIRQLTIEYNTTKSEARKRAILRDVKRLRASLKKTEA